MNESEIIDFHENDCVVFASQKIIEEERRWEGISLFYLSGLSSERKSTSTL